MTVEKGKTVQVHYVGTLNDGSTFDSSREHGEPLEFVVGEGMLLPAFEDAVLGKKVGDKMSITIPATEAYGEHQEELTVCVPIAEVPENVKPEVGLILQLNTDQGPIEALITRVDEDEIELDANHELAGQELSFEIEVITIK